MSGRDSLNTIGHAAVVGGSGIHRPLFQWDLPQSMLQNESRGYAIALTRVLAGCKLRFVTCLNAINSGFWTSLGELRKSIKKAADLEWENWPAVGENAGKVLQEG